MYSQVAAGDSGIRLEERRLARGCPFLRVWNASSGWPPWGTCAIASKRGSVWGWRRGSERVAWDRAPVALPAACPLAGSLRGQDRAGPTGAEPGPSQGQWQILFPELPALLFSEHKGLRDRDFHCVHAWPRDRVSTGTEDGQRAHGLEGVRGMVRTGHWAYGIWGGLKALALSQSDQENSHGAGEGARALEALGSP